MRRNPFRRGSAAGSAIAGVADGGCRRRIGLRGGRSCVDAAAGGLGRTVVGTRDRTEDRECAQTSSGDCLAVNCFHLVLPSLVADGLRAAILRLTNGDSM